MSDAPKRPLREARRIADALVRELGPACDRIELAGSIRRECDVVADIEIVAVPLYDEEIDDRQVDLFGGEFSSARVIPVSLLWDRIEQASEGHARILPIKPGAPGRELDMKWAEKRRAGSRYYRLWLPKPRMKVDLFLADRDTWGAVFAIRTGCAEFSQALVKRWTHVSGGHFKDGRVVAADGVALDTPEEEDVFRACQLDWIPPELRNHGDIEAITRASHG